MHIHIAYHFNSSFILFGFIYEHLFSIRRIADNTP